MSVTGPRGFRAAGVVAGLKESGRPDLAVVVNDGPAAAAAAVFTANRCKANPVLWTEQAVQDGSLRAVVLNSGGANCYTGAPGFQVTHATAEYAAKLFDIGAVDVAVCSTGLIGTHLDTEALLAGLDTAAVHLAADGGRAAAEAIMTTDTHAKEAEYDGDGWTVGGMAKGAGMLAPALATMLAVITTDAVADAATLDAALRAACRVSFDRIDTDGCMSTNDTVLLLASGASGVEAGEAELTNAVTEVCAELARQLVADAEGARHEIAIEVVGAASEDEALEVARAIARSNLFKCAIYGNDPNWGRVLAAVGTTRAAFDPAEIDVSFNGVHVCRAGGIGEPRERVDLSNRIVIVTVDLHAGPAAVTVWTTDLTHDYVTINAEYST